VVIPSAALVLCLLVGLIVVLVVIIKRKGNQSDDWEIEYDELEIGEQLGAGGYVATDRRHTIRSASLQLHLTQTCTRYGEVNKATWKGTEVAVKVMASDKITKDMEKNFKDEVRANPILEIGYQGTLC
jgi:hypothetical protein